MAPGERGSVSDFPPTLQTFLSPGLKSVAAFERIKSEPEIPTLRKTRRCIVFRLFKKSDKPKVDAAEIERREREERKREMAQKLKQEMQASSETEQKKSG